MRKHNEDRAELFANVAERFLAIRIPTRTADKLARLNANVQSLNQWFCAAPIDSLSVEWVEEFALARLAQDGEAQMLSEIKTLKAILAFGLQPAAKQKKPAATTNSHPLAHLVTHQISTGSQFSGTTTTQPNRKARKHHWGAEQCSPLQGSIGRKENTMRVAIYARVSTNHQSADMQLAELREYCSRRKWTITSEYVDHAVSGSKERRPQLDRLMKDCRKRLADAVIVFRYDRFARSLRQLVSAMEEFQSLGVQFVSLHEGTDTTTPNGRLVFSIFAAISEFERELIKERVRSGIAHARSKGTRLGRPPVDVDISSLRQMRKDGRGWKSIAAEMRKGVGTIMKAAKQNGIA